MNPERELPSPHAAGAAPDRLPNDDAGAIEQSVDAFTNMQFALAERAREKLLETTVANSARMADALESIAASLTAIAHAYHCELRGERDKLPACGAR